MDPNTGRIYENLEPIPAKALEAVKAMSSAERKAWAMNRQQRRAAARAARKARKKNR